MYDNSVEGDIVHTCRYNLGIAVNLCDVIFRYGLRYRCLSSISDSSVDYLVPMLSVETR